MSKDKEPVVLTQTQLLEEIAKSKKIVAESRAAMVSLKLLITDKERYIYECIDQLTKK